MLERCKGLPCLSRGWPTGWWTTSSWPTNVLDTQLLPWHATLQKASWELHSHWDLNIAVGDTKKVECTIYWYNHKLRSRYQFFSQSEFMVLKSLPIYCLVLIKMITSVKVLLVKLKGCYIITITYTKTMIIFIVKHLTILLTTTMSYTQ